MSSLSRQQLEAWLKTIEVKGDKCLDVGGSQNPLSDKRLKVFEPDEYKILDLEQPHECKKKPDFIYDINNKDECAPNNLVNWRHTGNENLSYEDEKNCVEFEQGGADNVFCLEVSEYWYNPLFALEQLAWLTKQNGILYISFHFIYPAHNPIEQDYLRYTPSGVEKLLKETGFEILEMKPRLLSDAGEATYNHLIGVEQMRPAKNYDKHNWSGCLVKCKKL